MPLDEKDLIARAKSGDAQAFDRLSTAARPQVLALMRRMIGHPEDAEDVAQEATIAAWNNIAGFRGDAAFATWLTAIAARKAADHLRRQKRWRREAQVAYANLCATSETLSGEVVSTASDPEFVFDLREHVAYCFTCVGRSLPPDEHAALVLRDVVGMSAREASTALGVSDSVLRHRLAAARAAMTGTYDGLCALVNKQGICHQCKGLRALASKDRKGPPVPDIDDFAQRIALVRAAPPHGGMDALHDLFWRRTKQVEDDDLGSTVTASDCAAPTE